jgi:TPR repeat protein
MKSFFVLFLCAVTSHAQISGSYEELLAKAHAGDGNAAYSLGKLYEYPTSGKPPDFKGAAYWYTQASRDGVPEATVDLALLYLTGEGVPRDDTKALELYESAAKTGRPKAMTRLGEMMIAKKYKGNGEYFGRPWINKAAELGEPDALNDLGWMEMNYGPVGVAPPIRTALAYFEKAVQAGSCSALFNLANLYLHGSYEYNFAQDAATAQNYLAKVQTCPTASLDLKRQAADLEQRTARGELPPLSRQPTYGTQNGQINETVIAISTFAAMAGLLSLLHGGVNSGTSSSVNTGYGVTHGYGSRACLEGQLGLNDRTFLSCY